MRIRRVVVGAWVGCAALVLLLTMSSLADFKTKVLLGVTLFGVAIGFPLLLAASAALLSRSYVARRKAIFFRLGMGILRLPLYDCTHVVPVATHLKTIGREAPCGTTLGRRLLGR